jgi:hypothetical protein
MKSCLFSHGLVFNIETTSKEIIQEALFKDSSSSFKPNVDSVNYTVLKQDLVELILSLKT